MKKFKFTLYKLYEVKESDEKQKRAELKQLNRDLQAYQKQRQANQTLFDRQYSDYERKCRQGTTMREVKQCGEFLQYLEKEIRVQNTVIAACENSIAQCRSELLKIINEKNVLDRMRAEQYQAYLKEIQKDEDKQIEDFMQARV